MNPVTRDRLFGAHQAFDHPVTVWIVAGVVGLLLIAPAIIWFTGRSGKKPDKQRELWLRYRSWLVLTPLMIAPILLGAAWTIMAVFVLSLLCYREYARATGLFRETLTSAVVVLGILAVALTVADHWYTMFIALPPLVIVILAATTIFEDRPKGYIQRVGLGALGFMLFGSGLGHFAYFANDTLFRPILLLLLLTVELNDVFAFITGKLLGRRKLAPNTSPNKTIAGSLGSILLTTPLVAVLAHFIFTGTAIDRPLQLIMLGLIVAVGGQLGDLMLSSIKRDIGVKDLGVTIPGHGGLLDRFDSLLLVAPAVFHFVRYLSEVGLTEPAHIFTGE
jgi:phosphatidate cytidylyltransferase